MQRPLFVLTGTDDLITAVGDSVYDLANLTGYSVRHLTRLFSRARDGKTNRAAIVWVDWTDAEWREIKS